MPGVNAAIHRGAAAGRQVVVVGNGMVGHRFVELAAAVPGVALTVFGEEPRTAYDRVHLSDYFAGAGVEDLALPGPPAGATVHVGERVTAINRASRVVRTDRDRRVRYDTLVLATGSCPFVPPIDGRGLPHCHVYRTIEDLDAIRACSADAETGVAVGGGLLGLEAANALRNMGLVTHVVEFAPSLMGTQLDDGGGAMLRDCHRRGLCDLRPEHPRRRRVRALRRQDLRPGRTRLRDGQGGDRRPGRARDRRVPGRGHEHEAEAPRCRGRQRRGRPWPHAGRGHLHVHRRTRASTNASW